MSSNSFSSQLVTNPTILVRGHTMFTSGFMLVLQAEIWQTYKALEKTLKSGKTRAIGISNFSRIEIERLLKETSVVPAAHQLELHPWLQQKEFIEFNKSKGIHISQYSP